MKQCLLLVALLAVDCSKPESNESVSQASTTKHELTLFHGVKVGENGVLRGNSGDRRAWIVGNKTELEEINKFLRSDSASVTRLINDNGTILDPGTKVKLLEVDYVDVRVKIVDGPHAGKTGWAWGSFFTAD